MFFDAPATQLRTLVPGCVSRCRILHGPRAYDRVGGRVSDVRDEGIDGFLLGEKMQAGAERFGAKTELAEVRSVDLMGKTKLVETSEGNFFGKVVISATGAAHRHLGVDKEESLIGRGVCYCAACDGMPYKGKTVVVVGGGNSAAFER